MSKKNPHKDDHEMITKVSVDVVNMLQKDYRNIRLGILGLSRAICACLVGINEPDEIDSSFENLVEGMRKQLKIMKEYDENKTRNP